MSEPVALRQLLRIRNVRTVALAMLVSAFGTGMFLAGSTIYFTTSGGFSPVELAGGLGIASVAGLVATVPIGSLGDWFGPKTLLVGLFLVRALAFVLLAFVGDVVTFAVVASVQVVCQQGSTPILQALVGSTTGDGSRTTTLALVRSIRNIGFAAGALAAAPLIATHDLGLNRSVIIGTGVAVAAGGLLLTRVRLSAGPLVTRAASPFAGLRSVWDVRYMGMAGFNGVLSLHMTMLAVGFPLWIASRADISNSFAPFVLALNTVVVVVAQVWFARGVTSGRAARRAVWWSAAALASACGALALADGLPTAAAVGLLVLATLVFTGGEMWQSAGSWELSFRLAPEATRSTHLSVFALGVAAQDAWGPLLLATAVLPHGALGWLGLAGIFVLGAAGMTAFARRCEALREPASVGAVLEA